VVHSIGFDRHLAGVRLQRGRQPPAHLPQGAGPDAALSSNRQDVSHNFNYHFVNCTSLVCVLIVTRVGATAGGVPATTSTSLPRSAAASAAFPPHPAQRVISARPWVLALLLSPQRRPMPRLLLQRCHLHRNLSLVSRCPAHTPPRPLLLLQATQTPAPASYLHQNFCLRRHHLHPLPPVQPPLPFSPQSERSWVLSEAAAAAMHLQLRLTRCGSRRRSAPRAYPACMYAPLSLVFSTSECHICLQAEVAKLQKAVLAKKQELAKVARRCSRVVDPWRVTRDNMALVLLQLTRIAVVSGRNQRVVSHER
jgi:hypothetical protein